MSPRSEELIEEARARVSEAHRALAADLLASAVSAAYYATLYAARAALSEGDRYAKTHGGTWTLFSELFVATQRFDRELYAAAQKARETREASDYDAQHATPAEAAAIVAQAKQFVAAIESLLAT